MLQAVTKNGDFVTLPLLPHEEIIQLKNSKSQFFCPVCQSQLLIKVGKKVIAHFAHRYQQECPNQERGEGVYHERGKLDLFYWLLKQGYPVKLEHYLHTIKQRADLFIHLNNKKIAIEYQCAKIPIDQILKRTNGYQAVGITPIWILGGNRMNRIGQQVLSLLPAEQNFLQQFLNDRWPKLFYYCPDVKQLARYDLICLSGRKRTIGQLRFMPLEETSFKHLFQPNHVEVFTDQWLVEKRRFRLYLPKRTYSHESQFREWLYLNQLTPSLLSSWVGLPVVGQWLMKVSLWIWQARLCYDFFNKQSHFTLDQLQVFIQPYRKKIYSQYPLLQRKEDPVINYLNYFILGGKIIRSRDGYFVNGRISQYQTIEQAFRNDQQIQNRLKNRMHYTHEKD